MWIIGCDFHPSYQQIAAFDNTTGEALERRLRHAEDEVEKFYASLPRGAWWAWKPRSPRSGSSASSSVAVISCGWAMRPKFARRRCASKNRSARCPAFAGVAAHRSFPAHLGAHSRRARPRQLLVHRHKLVRWRTQLSNQLVALARNQGLLLRRRSWSNCARQQLQACPLDFWAARRRQDLLLLLDQLDPQIQELTQRVQQEAQRRAEAAELMSAPGVGPVISLAFLLTLGTAQRFPRGKQVASYLGLNPSEHSSGGHQKLGPISKQGNALMRCLLVEAAWAAVRHDAELRRFFKRLAFRRGRKIAIVAVARKLAVKLYWRLRNFELQHPAPPAPMQGRSGRGVVTATASSSL